MVSANYDTDKEAWLVCQEHGLIWSVVFVDSGPHKWNASFLVFMQFKGNFAQIIDCTPFFGVGAPGKCWIHCWQRMLMIYLSQFYLKTPLNQRKLSFKGAPLMCISVFQHTRGCAKLSVTEIAFNWCVLRPKVVIDLTLGIKHQHICWVTVKGLTNQLNYSILANQLKVLLWNAYFYYF